MFRFPSLVLVTLLITAALIDFAMIAGTSHAVAAAEPLVKFIVGDHLVSEGGTWRSDQGPLDGPHNCVVDANDALLVSDSWNHCVRRIDLKNMLVQTRAGTGKAGFSGDGGPASDADFDFVMCISLNPAGSVMHHTD